MDWLWGGLIGVGGTLLGTVLGFLLSQLGKIGKHKFIIENFKYKYYFGNGPYGDICDDNYEKDGTIAEATIIEAEMYITNSSEVTFNLNRPMLLIKNKKEIFKTSLLNVSERKIQGGFINTPKLKVVDVTNKSCFYTKIEAKIVGVVKIEEKQKFYIEYVDVKGRTKRKRIIIKEMMK